MSTSQRLSGGNKAERRRRTVVGSRPNAVEMQAARAGETRTGDLDANSRLPKQYCERGLEIFTKGLWSTEPVFAPPCIGSFDLSCRSCRDTQSKGHCFAARSSRANSSSAEMASPR
jgi:hypothetical protein